MSPAAPNTIIDHSKNAHLSPWSTLAIVLVALILAAVLYYSVASCYSSAKANPPLLLDSKMRLNYSQESLIKSPERAFTVDNNAIPFYEPAHPPLCTKVTKSNLKLCPVAGPQVHGVPYTQ